MTLVKTLNSVIAGKRKMQSNHLVAVMMPDGIIQIEWAPSATGRVNKLSALLQNEIHEQYSSDPDGWLFYLGFCNKNISLSPSLAFWRSFSGLFIRKLKLTPDLEELRGEVDIPLSGEDIATLQGQVPLMTGGEYLHEGVFFVLWEMLHEIFSWKIEEYEGSVAGFFKEYNPDVHLVGRIYFHLVENKDHEVPFAFLATYSTMLNDEGESRHLPLKYALQEYEGDNQKLLELLVTVHDAAKQSDLVAELLDSGDLFQPLAWSAKEAFTFFQEIPLYEEAGILCRIPNWWKGKAASIGLHVSIGEKTPSTVGMDALLDFSPRLMIGDTEMSEEEARRLLDESEGLAFLKNKWVAVDPEKLKQTLTAYEKALKLNSEAGISILDALRLSMNPRKLLGVEEGELLSGISNGEWLRSVFEKLQSPETLAPVKTAKSFKGKLRSYQRDGLKWLFSLHTLKFGALLADDMGLGKTVQVLAFLNVLKTEEKKGKGRSRPSLLVIPASLLSNWLKEIDSFYPSLVCFAAHPDLHKPGKMQEPTPEKLDGLDLVITTYALVQRYEWLQDYCWNYVILDEAQAIKNPGTKQTKAVKELTADNRIVMTGTPVENRLSDLWSLFDFLNPGLLGNAKEFGLFSKGLANNPKGYAGLRKMISPFILRRLKTDKAIISDLPDKVEVKSWAAMSKKQTVLYGNVPVGKRKELIEKFQGQEYVPYFVLSLKA